VQEKKSFPKENDAISDDCRSGVQAGALIASKESVGMVSVFVVRIYNRTPLAAQANSFAPAFCPEGRQAACRLANNFSTADAAKPQLTTPPISSIVKA
jgi:hypothetical protein